MSASERQSALASRHIALGSDLEDWNGMGTAWSYHSDPEREHDAIREAVGVFDMSPLKKVFVRGPDAGRAVDHVLSRDMTRVGEGQACYGTVLTDDGMVCDDAIVANNGGGEWMHCHGSGESMERLQESAESLNVDIELDDDLHNISVQGPQALALLDAHTNVDLATLPYFHHLAAEVFGHPCRLSRTGYSGERGYEIFAGSAVVGDIWDQVLGHGEALGVMPCSFASLDKVRIEAGLLFYGYDMSTDNTPWEAGLGFTISSNKADYRGMQAALASRGKERILPGGIVVEHNESLVGGEVLRLNGADVGVVNSPCYSHRLGKSLALVHLSSEAAKPGTRLDVVSDEFNGSAEVADVPFFDPNKSRTHA